MLIQPPRAATSLLTIFLPEQDRDAVMGDLVEEFQSRRSASWFWMQVLRSLGHLSWLGMRRSPWRTVAAMLVGYAVTAAIVGASFVAWEALRGSSSPRAMLLVEFLGGALAATVGGYVAARISRGSGANGIVALSAFTLLMGLLSLATEPLWRELALVAVFVLGVLFGGFLRARQAARPAAPNAGALTVGGLT